MRIEIKGRNCPVSADLREHAERRFEKIARQVPLAELELELSHERNPAISEPEVVDATLYLKGVTLRASDASRDMTHSLNLCSEELARQVKRHRARRRRRRETPSLGSLPPATEAPSLGSLPPASETPSAGPLPPASDSLDGPSPAV